MIQFAILEIKDCDIEKLWNTSSKFKMSDPFIKLPKTIKTLKALSKKFIILIDNCPQDFSDFCR